MQSAFTGSVRSLGRPPALEKLRKVLKRIGLYIYIYLSDRDLSYKGFPLKGR